jgi:hypothetical protein
VALGAPEVEDAASGRAGVVLGSSLKTTTPWVRPENFWDDVAGIAAPG